MAKLTEYAKCAVWQFCPFSLIVRYSFSALCTLGLLRIPSVTLSASFVPQECSLHSWETFPPTFRLPRVLPSIHWRHYSLCHFRKAIRHAHEDFFCTFGMHIRLFSFPESVGWRFWVTFVLIFVSEKLDSERLWHSLMSAMTGSWLHKFL